MGELELCTRYRHVMDLDVMMIFLVPLVTIPLYYYFYLFSTKVFTVVPTINWNLAYDLLMIKLLVEYPFQKDYIMN